MTSLRDLASLAAITGFAALVAVLAPILAR